jgi:hypothetical protein
MIGGILQFFAFFWQGIGRFVTNSKSILHVHDTSLQKIVLGPDKDRFKAICRSETVSSKILYTTNCVKNLHLLVTSNEHMFEHNFPTETNPLKRKCPPDFLPHAKMAKLNRPDFDAVKRRFIELYVRYANQS